MIRLSARQQQCLRLMGIQHWIARSAPAVEPGISVRQEPQRLTGEASAEQELRHLAEQVSACTRCDLHRHRDRAVFGIGSALASWMFVGEAPGAEEDRRGEPFVGRAGKLLDAMLAALGLTRKEVYIANIVKCRPPKNRDPLPEEARCCSSYLDAQLRLVRPRLVLALGRVAAQSLLATQQPVGQLRSQVHRLPKLDIPLVVSYHPAYLLRSPKQKRKAWQDLLLARQVMEGAA